MHRASVDVAYSAFTTRHKETQSKRFAKIRIICEWRVETHFTPRTVPTRPSGVRTRSRRQKPNGARSSGVVQYVDDAAFFFPDFFLPDFFAAGAIHTPAASPSGPAPHSLLSLSLPFSFVPLFLQGQTDFRFGGVCCWRQ